MLPKRIAPVVGVLAVASLAVPPAVSAGRMIERDFHATYTAEYQPPELVEHTCQPGELANLLLGEGVGSLIGRFDLRIEACVDPLTGGVNGTAFCTAANGDLLGFDFEGSVVFSDGVTTVAELPAVDAFGDGRFAGVELGSGEGLAVDTTVGFTSSGVVRGPIVYDASNRSDS